MKKILLFSALFMAVALLSCKKNKLYTCTCENPGGENVIFRKMTSEKNAKADCDKYYDDNFGNIPMNETHCWVE